LIITLQNVNMLFHLIHKLKKYFEKYGFNSLLKRTSIFAQDNDALMQVSQEILISSEEVLKYLVNDYSADHFSLDVRKGFYFSVEDKVYTLDRSQFGYADENQFISSVLKILEPILLNKNIVKIVPDLKANYYHLHYCKMENVFDISLANYLIKGGIKPDVYKDCTKFYNIYKEQIAKMQELNLLDLYYNIELPLEKVLYFMEKEGFAVDKDFLHTLAEGYKKELLMLENQIKSYSSRLGFNVKSPRQIGELLYVELGITDKFNRQHATNVDKLQLIINEHPVVPIILRYRKVLKLYSTYIEPYEKMLKTRENNILYTVFNQMQTSTGRLSSSEPNLQNIPVRDEEGKALRKIFISRFDGGKIVSADYNQIELRLLANFSNDNKLLNDYNSGSDIHRVTASQIFGVPCEEITNKQRQVAKAVNFGIIYGMSSFGLAKNIDISIKEAKQYISVYFEKYPGVKDYLDGLVQSAKQLGFARTLFGRIRNVPEISSSNGMQRTLGERIAMNMPLQGSASDIIKLAMLNVYNRFEKEKINSKLILQIHDELIVDVYPGEEQLVQDILQEEMQNVYQFKVPLLIGIGMGKTWYDCK